MLRIPLGPKTLLVAATIAGAAVCWRAGSGRRAERLTRAVDDAIAEGRAAAERIGAGPSLTMERFDGH